MEHCSSVVREGAGAWLLNGVAARSRAHHQHVTLTVWIIYVGYILNLAIVNNSVVDCAPVLLEEWNDFGFGGRQQRSSQLEFVADESSERRLHVSSENLLKKPTGAHGIVQDGFPGPSLRSVGNEQPKIQNGDNKLETDPVPEMHNNVNTTPLLLVPDNLKPDETHKDPTNTTGHIVIMEYEPNVVIRCAAKGNPRPNVTWEQEDGSLPEYVMTNRLTYSNSSDTRNATNDEEVWVDLKLPKLNNAFYGRLRCRAENANGNATWEIELVHNANSSVFMKLVRGTVATVLLVIAILIFKLAVWYRNRLKEKLYEKLPAQDLEIINKFKRGIPPPPPTPSSSILQAGVVTASCVPMIEIKIDDLGNGGGLIGQGGNGNAISRGYRPVPHNPSTPDLQKRGGGASTPTSCMSVHVVDSINGWTNYVPYDDKLETSSQHFNVDFSHTIENGRYGMMFAGKIRNDLTMKWSSVAVKTGKTERDDNFLLESILTELKILASLHRSHENIVNLKGAYTKLLHERQALVFVDYCENGNLANYIDLNHQNFRDIFAHDLDLISAIPPTANNNLASCSPQNPGNSAAAASVIMNGDIKPCNSAKSPKVDQDLTKDIPKQIFSQKLLLAWAWQIADGMSYLHKNRIIHGNLCSENVYLTSRLTAKIGNIGYPPEESQECIDNTTKKWLTIPKFGYEHFSTKSDVCEYGRLLWEIFSLRMQPCPDKQSILEFLQNEQTQQEQRGLSVDIEVPEYATPEIFDLILLCWTEDGTYCPEFDLFGKVFKQLHREMFPSSPSTTTTSVGGSSLTKSQQIMETTFLQ